VQAKAAQVLVLAHIRAESRPDYIESVPHLSACNTSKTR
jgi:hypothetical protein